MHSCVFYNFIIYTKHISQQLTCWACDSSDWTLGFKRELYTSENRHSTTQIVHHKNNS